MSRPAEPPQPAATASKKELREVRKAAREQIQSLRGAVVPMLLWFTLLWYAHYMFMCASSFINGVLC